MIQLLQTSSLSLSLDELQTQSKGEKKSEKKLLWFSLQKETLKVTKESLMLYYSQEENSINSPMWQAEGSKSGVS